MKINRMPTTIVLLVSSWLTAIFGVTLGGYLIIFKFHDPNSLIRSFLVLLASLLLAGIARTLGNIGQILFELKAQLQTQTTALSNDLKDLLQKTAALSNDLKDLLQKTAVFSQDIKGLNQELTNQLQTQTAVLSNDLQALLQKTTAFSQDIKGLNQELKAQLQTQTSVLSNNLLALETSLQQINCNSKEINQNINQIKTFFEQIERHLDLKK